MFILPQTGRWTLENVISHSNMNTLTLSPGHTHNEDTCTLRHGHLRFSGADKYISTDTHTHTHCIKHTVLLSRVCWRQLQLKDIVRMAIHHHWVGNWAAERLWMQPQSVSQRTHRLVSHGWPSIACPDNKSRKVRAAWSAEWKKVLEPADGMSLEQIQSVYSSFL